MAPLRAVNSKKEEKVVMTLSRERQLKAIWVAKQKLLNDKKELCQTHPAACPGCHGYAVGPGTRGEGVRRWVGRWTPRVWIYIFGGLLSDFWGDWVGWVAVGGAVGGGQGKKKIWAGPVRWQSWPQGFST